MRFQLAILALCTIVSGSLRADEMANLATAISQVQTAISRAKDGKAPACPVSLARTRKFVFAFEGAKGFCPLLALRDLPNAGWGNRSVGNYVADVAYRYEIFAVQKAAELRTLVGADFEKRLDQESKSRNCHLASSLAREMPWRWESYDPVSSSAVDARQILYYSWAHQEEALDCLLSLSTKAFVSREQIDVSIVGHSLGGYAAAKFYENLQGIANLSVTEVLTLDSVPVSRKIIGSLSGDPAPISVKFGKPFRRWQNFYQRSDRGSAYLVSILGTEIQMDRDKVENHFVGPDELREFGDYVHGGAERVMRAAHIAILRLSKIRTAVREFLEN